MNILSAKLGRWLARFLEKPSRKYEPFDVSKLVNLQRCLQPGDVLLVEGNQRISSAIKYLTQSTWSHALLFVGDAVGTHDAAGGLDCLLEADLTHGVVVVPLSRYASFNTRICRPVNLCEADRTKLIEYAVARIGFSYDLKNIIDLARYLLPTPPVPVRWRRRLLALGSGHPTRAICSTLIAQAFESIKYPILPIRAQVLMRQAESGTYIEQEIFHIRHHSLYTPRDFDVSPYFQIIKPTLECGFDYREALWQADNGDVCRGGFDAEPPKK